MNLDDTAARLRECEYAFAMELAEYVERLKKQYVESPDIARREAEQVLVRTGVIGGHRKMKWKVPVTWEMYGTIEIEAGSAKEAVQKAQDYEGELPAESYYVDDSWQTSCDADELSLFQKKQV